LRTDIFILTLTLNTNMNKEKLLIIGAGISGLYTAMLLQENYEVTILEARDTVGGRVMDVSGHDMGPSWVWEHQKNILALIESLEIELTEQYREGFALYDSPEGVQRFNAPHSAPSARIKGGVTAIVDALYQKLKCSVLPNTAVESVRESDGALVVESSRGIFEVDRVISTLPPRLALESIEYDPELPEKVKEDFENIPTWMGYAAKCVIEFEEPFWRDEGLSGFAFSHFGPLGEIHDACTEQTAALFGFLHSRAGMENIEADVRAQLRRMYGEQAANPKNIYLIDWKKEHYTSTLLDALPLRDHPHYGFDISHFNGKMLFSGTESAFQEGGYLEGAINAAKSVEKKLL